MHMTQYTETSRIEITKPPADIQDRSNEKKDVPPGELDLIHGGVTGDDGGCIPMPGRRKLF